MPELATGGHKLGSERDRRWLALGLLAVTQFMVILDQTVVTIAMPSIGRGLDIPQGGLSWIINAYVLTFGGFLMLGGRACDLLGRRRMFIAGLLLFAVSSLAGGFAVNEPMLIVSRAIQGVGSAILAPAALASVAGTFTDSAERNRALGIWAGAAGSGGAVGVVLGGLLTSGPGWPWVFWINVPVGLIGAALAPLVLSEGTVGGPGRHRFDFAGAIAVTGGVSLVIYGLTQGEQAGWASTRTLVTFGAALVLLIAFVITEQRSPQPLMSFSIFRVHGLAVANGTMLLFSASIYGVMFLLSLYLQQVLGYSAFHAGLAYIPLAMGVVFGPVGGRLLNLIGTRATVFAGLTMGTLGVIWFTQISTDGTFLVNVLGPSLLIASGGQFAVVGLTLSAVSGVDASDQGLASGMFNTSREIGGALGVGILATVALAQTGAVSGSAAPDGAALTHGFQAGMIAAVGLALLGVLLAFSRMPRARAAALPEAPQSETSPV